MLFFKVNATSVVDTLEAVVTEDIERLFDNIYSLSLYVMVIVFLIVLIYWIFYVPCSWTKRLDDVGYDLALGNSRKANLIHKKDAINRIRRLRAIGINELPPPFPNGWYSVLESSELKAGEAKSISCIGENFVVYRTLENQVHILDAYCPHMGANLGVGGKVVGDNITCPFHLWSFRGSDGKCTNIPYSSCVPQGIKVRKWHSREVNGNIFVWYHAEAEEPWELPVVEEIENQEFIFHGRNEFYVNCHIQEIPENGADLAHFAGIHNAGLLAGVVDPPSSALANIGTHHWQGAWKSSENANKHFAFVTLKHSVELLPKFHVFHMNVLAQQAGPSYVLLHMKSPTFGRLEVLQTVTPIEPLVQKVVHRFYAPRIVAPFMKFALLGESMMFERDMTMWNHKIYRKKPELAKEDAAIKSFRNWYTQFYTENSKSFAEARDNLSW